MDACIGASFTSAVKSRKLARRIARAVYERGRMNEARHHAEKPTLFDTARLDALLGIDVLVATSKHNVQYLLGGYRFSLLPIRSPSALLQITSVNRL